MIINYDAINPHYRATSTLYISGNIASEFADLRHDKTNVTFLQFLYRNICSLLILSFLNSAGATISVHNWVELDGATKTPSLVMSPDYLQVRNVAM